ncbi:MAG TPA: glycosyltransferase family 2 protein [Thermoleophilaceae bacterium]|nr:glycosyltransferase family 2 protein [Thermoleophilaceae bacterium]
MVNTNGREYLRSCLAAIERVHPPGLERELLVLDNHSDDGSAAMVREQWPQARLIELDRRTGKAENDSTLLRAATGRHCLLLNEDTELQDGSVAALVAALDDDRGAAAAGAQLLTADGTPTACAWRLPGLGTALATAVFAHRNLVVQSRGRETRPVGWVQSSAMLVRRTAAEQVDYLDPDFFVYSDETDFCKRLHDAGWRVLFVPGARAVHHDQLNTDLAASRRRIVEFHRNRDLYLRKHHGPLTRLVVRALGAWFYLATAAAAVVVPGHDPRRYLLNARQELAPGSGEGIREAAAEYNSALHGTP